MSRFRTLLSSLFSARVPTLGGAVSWQRYFVNLTKLFFGAHLFVEYIGVPKQTSGPSMLPTIYYQGEWIWVNNMYRRGKGIVVGDVVSFKHPMFPGETASKRVLGLGGDYVLRDTPGGGSTLMIQVRE